MFNIFYSMTLWSSITQGQDKCKKVVHRNSKLLGETAEFTGRLPKITWMFGTAHPVNHDVSCQSFSEIIAELTWTAPASLAVPGSAPWTADNINSGSELISNLSGLKMEGMSTCSSSSPDACDQFNQITNESF